MNLNPDKCHLTLSSKENRGINVGKRCHQKFAKWKLIGVLFNEKATFGYHTENMCIKASRKLQALACVASTIHGPIRKKIFNECFFQYLQFAV